MRFSDAWVMRVVVALAVLVQSGCEQTRASRSDAGVAPVDPHAHADGAMPRLRSNGDPTFDALHERCGRADPRSCRALGEYVSSEDASLAKLSFRRACIHGGLAVSDVDACVEFLTNLQHPPRCPRPLEPVTLTYAHCPSERKRAPKLKGSLTLQFASAPSTLQAEVRKARRNLWTCYAAGLERGPNWEDAYQVDAIFDRSGALMNIRLEPNVADPFARECFVRELAKLRVEAAPDQAVQVQLTLQLRAAP